VADDDADKVAKQIKDLQDKLESLEADRDKWKELSKKHETRSKADLEELERLKKLQDSSKSESEKVAEKLTALEKRAEEADARALRAEVAAEKGLTAAQAKRLAGGTKEELEADADELLDSFKPTGKDGESDKGTRGSRPASRPRESLSGGTDPTGDTPTETNPAKLAESVPRY
jgi:chromosome segregation ATPase